MALSAKDKADIAELVAQAIASAFTSVSAPVAPAQAGQPEHIGPSGKPDGRRFPCTADGGCGRLLRSKARAAIHGVDAGGHEAASAD